MSDLSNADIIRILRKRQNCGFHEYTCGGETCGAVLEPVEVDGKVVLVCTKCWDWKQDAPPVTREYEEAIDERRRIMRIKD